LIAGSSIVATTRQLNKPVSKLPELRGAPAGRVRNALSKAQAILERDVLDFFRALTLEDVYRKLGHHPSSRDLLPYFTAYAIAAITAHFAERRDQFATVESQIALLSQIAEDVTTWISVSKMWSQTVARAWEQVGVEIYFSEFAGEHAFGENAFSDQPRHDLRAAIRSHVLQMEAELWDAATDSIESRDRTAFLRNVRALFQAARKGRNVKQFAKELKTNPTVIYRLCHGQLRCSLERLADIAKSMGCAPEDLYRP
jgi:hypothetical protein